MNWCLSIRQIIIFLVKLIIYFTIIFFFHKILALIIIIFFLFTIILILFLPFKSFLVFLIFLIITVALLAFFIDYLLYLLVSFIGLSHHCFLSHFKGILIFIIVLIIIVWLFLTIIKLLHNTSLIFILSKGLIFITWVKAVFKIYANIFHLKCSVIFFILKVFKFILIIRLTLISNTTSSFFWTSNCLSIVFGIWILLKLFNLISSSSYLLSLHHILEKLLIFIILFRCSLVSLHHKRYLFCKLKQVHAVFRITIDNLLSLNMRKVILEDFFWKKIDQSLNIFSHFFFSLSIFKWAKVYIWECTFKKLYVKLVRKKHSNIINRLFNTNISKDLVTKFKNSFNY